MKPRQLLEQAKPVLSEDQLLELKSAVYFATKKHEGQKRKSGEPYVSHPLSVASILMEWGMDSDTIIAGVLHDTIEDTDSSLIEIENEFGRDVAFLVDGVTKVSAARSGMRDLNSYLPTTTDNLTKLLIAVGQDVRVIIIKLADRLHNMQTLGYMPPAKQIKISRETLQVFAPLADRLNMGRVRVQLEEIAFSYLRPKTFTKLKKLSKDHLGKSHRKLSRVRSDITDRLKQEDISCTIDGRIKSIYSLHKKLKKVGDIDNVYDLIALRIVVDDIDTCYKVLSILHDTYEPQVERIKDYIARPKPNGYQSLHTTVMTEQGQLVEFQIRTTAMHEYAEKGLAASFHYNEQKLTDAYKTGKIASMPANLDWITQLQEMATQVSEGKEISANQLKIDLFGDRMFVYSPKGDIYDMPTGAYPLDFAYRIHSDLAKHTTGFKVNGKMIPFTKKLQHGDTIEVITKRSALPKQEWLNLIITRHARDKLRSQLNANQKTS